MAYFGVSLKNNEEQQEFARLIKEAFWKYYERKWRHIHRRRNED